MAWGLGTMGETTCGVSQISCAIAEEPDCAIAHKLHLRGTPTVRRCSPQSSGEIREYPTQITLVPCENALCFGLVVAQHYESGHLDIPLGLLKGTSSLRLVAAGDPGNHHLCTALQLGVRRLHVYHHPPINPAQAQHNAGRH